MAVPAAFPRVLLRMRAAVDVDHTEGVALVVEEDQFLPVVVDDLRRWSHAGDASRKTEELRVLGVAVVVVVLHLRPELGSVPRPIHDRTLTDAAIALEIRQRA